MCRCLSAERPEMWRLTSHLSKAFVSVMFSRFTVYSTLDVSQQKPSNHSVWYFCANVKLILSGVHGAFDIKVVKLTIIKKFIFWGVSLRWTEPVSRWNCAPNWTQAHASEQRASEPPPTMTMFMMRARLRCVASCPQAEKTRVLWVLFVMSVTHLWNMHF